jgi:hypothetical protein
VDCICLVAVLLGVTGECDDRGCVCTQPCCIF